jgi:hypothetical protein
MVSDRRLLILSCSQRKRPDSTPMPALERYDGPMFRVLRKFLRESPSKECHPDVYILSAQFGLILADQLIPNYDCQMTPQLASKLQPQMHAEFRSLLKHKQYEKSFISVGKSYAAALAGYEQLIPAQMEVIVPRGSRGRKQAELYDWLYGAPPPMPSHMSRVAPHIRGIRVTLTPEQVFESARSALAKTPGQSNRYQSWYVVVDNQQVSVKWLVSQITGLPVSAFVSDEAWRLLVQLGIKVMRA